MRFKSTRVIDRLALPITRTCNRKCPECPARERDANSHYEPTVDELRWAGKTIGPIAHVEVTGGEPSLHPDFETIAAGIHDWFDCKDVLLLTNGGIFADPDRLPLLLKFDRVYVTHYTPAFAERHKTPSNTDVVNAIDGYLKSQGRECWVQQMDAHVAFGIGPRRTPCRCAFGYDENDMVAYYRGQIYGCCTAWQLNERGRGIVLTDGWRADLADIDLPCDRCFLGTTRGLE